MAAAAAPAFEALHVAIDDQSRLAFTAMLPNQQAATTIDFLRQAMALVVVGVSVFVATGCQGEDKPAPLPNLPPTTAPSESNTKSTPASGRAAGSAASGARAAKFGEPAK